MSSSPERRNEPALGRAEVSLTIDNSAGLLPIDFTEVTITRVLFRAGDSEYLINGAPCRLLDIQELLSDSGVGRTQHVIVSQGQIDAVLNARPEERRAVIEEAAGVLKYRRRKERAERRLEATEANMLRVQDLLREVRRQLRPLERQAEAARRHGDVVSELGALRVYLAGREFAGFRNKLDTLAAERTDIVDRERTAREAVAAVEIEIHDTEARLAALGGFDLGDQLTRAEQLTERARGLSAVLGERRRGLEHDRGRLLDDGVIANLEGEAGRLRAELVEVTAGRDRLGPDSESVLLAEQDLMQQRDVFEQVSGGSDDSLGAAAVGAAAEVRGELRTLRQAVDRGSSESARLAARLTALAERAERLDGEISRFRGECEDSEATEQPLVEDMQHAETARLAAAVAAEQNEAALRNAQSEHSRWVARAEALGLALDEARARAGAERLAGVDGVVGTLLELVDIDPGWEAAFESAAGESLSAVVVDGIEAARRALSTLSDADVAGAVLALDPRSVAVVTPPIGDSVRAHVRSTRPGVDQLLDRLVGGAVVVNGGWAAAIDVAMAHPNAVVVTLDGGRFGASGWRVGGVATGATGAALTESTEQVERTRQLVAGADAAFMSARDELAQATQRETELVRRLDALDARFTAAANSLGRSQSERREAATEVEALSATAYELDGRLERERGRIQELESILPDLEAQENAQLEAARARRQTGYDSTNSPLRSPLNAASSRFVAPGSRSASRS